VRHAKRRLHWVGGLALVGFLSLGFGSCGPFGFGSPFLRFEEPLFSQLSLAEEVPLALRVGPFIDPDSVAVELDGESIPADRLTPGRRGFSGALDALEEGKHLLRAEAELQFLFFFRIPLVAATAFEVVDLEDPEACESLNGVECLLPWPSSQFLEEAPGETETGYRTVLPARGFPELDGDPIDPAPFGGFDGFSPGAQILMHFPQGVDLDASGAPVLLEPGCCGQSPTPPLVDVRTQNERSLEPDSPTVLIDAETGERILHWVELDALAEDPARQALFLRPSIVLEPGRRYIVAVRGLVAPNGRRVKPEPVFRALRDRSPTTIDAVEERRDRFEDIFRTLRGVGVERGDLVLAFDFVVRSQDQLTRQMLTMRDDALSYLDSLPPTDVSGFDIQEVDAFGDCTDPGQRIWKRVSGTFAGPSYLTRSLNDPALNGPVPREEIPFLSEDEDGIPVRNGTDPFAFDVAVPCSVFTGEDVGYPLLMGHGLFGDGAGFVDVFVDEEVLVESPLGGIPYIAGATDWRGLSSKDLFFLLSNVIGTSENRLNNFEALPDRLMQGQLNSLVLAHMMKAGFFNRLEEFQRVPGDPTTGVFTPDTESFYFGVSLGGIMGMFHAALSTDIVKYNVDVGAVNFSLILQRALPFEQFAALLEGVGLTDPMDTALGIGLLHELWVSAEPTPYVRHATGLQDPPLPGAPPKELLMTVAWLDKQVSNQGSEVAARSLGIPNLAGSFQEALPGIPDLDPGFEGVESGLVIYSTGSFDVFDPAFDGVVPPLANDIPSPECDPHGFPRLSIPASLEQLATFLVPEGRIFNFCDGACDASTDFERPAGVGPDELCDPLAESE